MQKKEGSERQEMRKRLFLLDVILAVFLISSLMTIFDDVKKVALSMNLSVSSQIEKVQVIEDYLILVLDFGNAVNKGLDPAYDELKELVLFVPESIMDLTAYLNEISKPR